MSAVSSTENIGPTKEGVIPDLEFPFETPPAIEVIADDRSMVFPGAERVSGPSLGDRPGPSPEQEIEAFQIGKVDPPGGPVILLDGRYLDADIPEGTP
jgi:hypothetical protein